MLLGTERFVERLMGELRDKRLFKKFLRHNGLRLDRRYGIYFPPVPERTIRDVMRPFVVRIWNMATVCPKLVASWGPALCGEQPPGESPGW